MNGTDIMKSAFERLLFFHIIKGNRAVLLHEKY
jgi:hypothetical protein